MGLSLHYRGKLADIQDVKAVCKTLTDIASKMNWRWVSLDEDWTKLADAKLKVTEKGAEIMGHLPLKGVSLTVDPKSESVSFFFDSEGNLCDPLNLIMITEGHLEPEDAWISVKTQFSSPETHIRIIGLLQYLKKHYIPDLQVFDEGEYWETGDFEILKEKMDFIADKIEAVANTLSLVSSGHISKYSPEELALMIEKIIEVKTEE
ncbi:hypothetical protein [Desulfonema magnum]|uniref:Uncharacterized protein n=1 Tax=Desulfonema magnum TaxID=45655 RepID=A0A975BGS2_9BACT|nr:hypothetical protein [Desulfonema magnum]QTA85008.1 Uncharacterized protein dnm_010120 [Desulfonema magnum]